MVSVDKAYMIGHMRNANGSLNNKNVVLSAACEAAELFQCMMEINQKLDDWQRFNHTLNMHLRSVEFMNGLRLTRGLFKKSREKISRREGLIWV